MYESYLKRLSRSINLFAPFFAKANASKESSSASFVRNRFAEEQTSLNLTFLHTFLPEQVSLNVEKQESALAASRFGKLCVLKAHSADSSDSTC